MTETAFRRDIQDELLRLLFDKYRMNFLKVPREDLKPGQAFLVPRTEDETPVAFGPVAIDGVVPGLLVPAPVLGARLADVDATYSTSSEGRAEGGVFSSLLAYILPGTTLPEINSKIEAKGGKRLYLRFSEATRDGLDFAALGRAVQSKSADLSMFDGADHMKIFAVTDVYRCAKVNMSWTRDGGHVVEADVVLAELAKLGAGHKAAKTADGTVTVSGDVALAFGVRLMELIPCDDATGLRLRLTHTKLDVLGVGSGGSQEKGSADTRDYPLLADPRSGQLGVEVRPMP